MASHFLIYPSPPTGNNRLIELAGLDLWKMARIDNVFVYPSEINISCFNEALSRTLSLWPIVAGRLRIDHGEHYIIEMCDNPIPVTLIKNDDLSQWPFHSNVVMDFYKNPITAYIDEVQVLKLFDNTQNEPLVRFKLTHITQSNEWVLGVSWAHELGDAFSCTHFLNTLSRLYQNMEPNEPLPVFERRLWATDNVDPSLFPLIEHFRNAKPFEEMWKKFMIDQEAYDQVDLIFSGEQIQKLRSFVDGDNITIHDVLIAYIILSLNTHCYYNKDDKRHILRTKTSVNFRGVSNSIAPWGQIGNAITLIFSDDFEDSCSLSSIAKAIRQSIIKSRDANFLERLLATADDAMRKMVHEDLLSDLGFVPHEILVNSNLRYDWAESVDFGYKDKCRFHTGWSGAFYLRIFRPNPIREGNAWLSRDKNGAEVTFRIEKDLTDIFLNAIQRDMNENFEKIKK